MNKYRAVAKAILEHCGGATNIGSVSHCATRLRLVLKDPSLSDELKLKTVPGLAGLLHRGSELHLVFGIEVNNIYQDFLELIYAFE